MGPSAKGGSSDYGPAGTKRAEPQDAGNAKQGHRSPPYRQHEASVTRRYNPRMLNIRWGIAL
jgi:hypothetical protein